MNLRCIPFQYLTSVTSHRIISSHYITRNCIPIHFTQYIRYVSGNGGDPNTAIKTELDISWSNILYIYDVYNCSWYHPFIGTSLAGQCWPHIFAEFRIEVSLGTSFKRMSQPTGASAIRREMSGGEDGKMGYFTGYLMVISLIQHETIIIYRL